MPRPALLATAALTLAAACTVEAPATPDASASDAAPDIAAPDATVDAGPPAPPWPHELPPARAMGEVRGFTTARVIVHAHSVHSHDACDGNPYVDGGPNRPCLANFRRSVCAARTDVVFLTEHEDRLSSVSLPTVLQPQPGDEPVTEDGAMVGLWIRCANGHRALVLPGAENELMPIGLRRHPDMVNNSLGRAYHADDAAGVRRFREAGALVAVAHVEQRSLAHLRALEPDLVEVYNVHANIGPNLAHIASPGFDLGRAFVDVLRFQRDARLEPDLAFLAFFTENVTDLARWAELWGEGRRIPGVAAADAHENSIPGILSDGERGDSYRRIFRFFSNEVLVRAPVTRAGVMESLRLGRSYVAFEALGTPEGFSCHAVGASGAVFEMGAAVPMAERPTLVVRAPTVHALPAELARPRVTVVVLRAEASRWVEAQRWAAPEGELRFPIPAAGAWRVEVRAVPEHARRYLPGMEHLVRELPWIYGNPIAVTP